jgi:hypothetical protein
MRLAGLTVSKRAAYSMTKCAVSQPDAEMKDVPPRPWPFAKGNENVPKHQDAVQLRAAGDGG